MFVVTLPASAAKNPAAFARSAKQSGAHLLEIRGDLTPNVKKFRSALPLLVSPRGSGKRLIEKFVPDYVDLELSEIALIPRLTKYTKLILSFHDDESTPTLAILLQMAERMLKHRPFGLKIVTTIDRYNQIARLQELRSRLKKRVKTLSIFAMGPYSHLTRVLSPLQDFCTYTFMEGEEPIAHGQLPLSFYHLLPVVRAPKIFGILGGMQITKSLSPVVHNTLFKRHKINALYSCFPADDFSSAFHDLDALGLAGCSVTAPFKHDAYKESSKKDAVSRALKVANTLVRTRNHWSAFNTDVAGIEHGYPLLWKAKTVAIAGAGGAVPSIILAIRKLNPKATVTVYARNTKKAAVALRHCRAPIKTIASLKKSAPDVILCAISADITIDLPRAKKGAIAIDLRYGTSTAFMKMAKRSGYHVYDGILMLIHQALKQFEYFTGKKPASSDAAYLQKILAAGPKGIS